MTEGKKVINGSAKKSPVAKAMGPTTSSSHGTGTELVKQFTLKMHP